MMVHDKNLWSCNGAPKRGNRMSLDSLGALTASSRGGGKCSIHPHKSTITSISSSPSVNLIPQLHHSIWRSKCSLIFD